MSGNHGGVILGDSPRKRLFEATRGLDAQAVEALIAKVAAARPTKQAI